jgi:dTDP-4-dehydrorhamnose 3,5-epimerase
MNVERFDIPGVLLLTPKMHGDQRGFFSEVFRVDQFAKAAGGINFVQDNHVYSSQRGVLRGLHFQTPPHAQGKLVRCTRGAILDVAVDIREGSPTYGRHVAVELSAANWQQLWVPAGFAHGYLTLEAECEVIYKVTDYYAPECDRGIAWDDPVLAIQWPVASADIILSEKDRVQPRLADAPPAFRYDD